MSSLVPIVYGSLTDRMDSYVMLLLGGLDEGYVEQGRLSARNRVKYMCCQDKEAFSSQ